MSPSIKITLSQLLCTSVWMVRVISQNWCPMFLSYFFSKKLSQNPSSWNSSTWRKLTFLVIQVFFLCTCHLNLTQNLNQGTLISVLSTKLSRQIMWGWTGVVVGGWQIRTSRQSLAGKLQLVWHDKQSGRAQVEFDWYIYLEANGEMRKRWAGGWERLRLLQGRWEWWHLQWQKSLWIWQRQAEKEWILNELWQYLLSNERTN